MMLTPLEYFDGHSNALRDDDDDGFVFGNHKNNNSNNSNNNKASINNDVLRVRRNGRVMIE